MNIAKHVVVIGAGPAGLMAAETLAQSGMQVDLYDAMPSVGRKFLLAGKGGMNITHSEPVDVFLSRYGARRDVFEPLLNAFGPDQLRDWIRQLGFNTFIGSSGRVFPTDMKAAPLLRAWLRRLRESGVRIHVRHRWCGWDERVASRSKKSAHAALCFETPQGRSSVKADAVILALGGGSWTRLGSDGAWVAPLEQCGVQIAPLQASNCGFDVGGIDKGWSEFFRNRFAGQPLKSVALSFTDASGKNLHRKGELMLSDTGVEGSLIYAVSAALRDEISAQGAVTIHLDLAPDKSLQRLTDEIAHPRGSRSLASHLQSRAGIRGAKMGLLREIVPAPDFADPLRLANAIKSLPVKLIASRPIDEAISSAGGVVFEELDPHLMLRNVPGVFCAGEMLDWEAPTGGYLLTGCFASGRAAGLGALHWLNTEHATTD
ncbi:MAG: TIGR03862 family flavoprotein [Thiobacillaceae bacterium]